LKMVWFILYNLFIYPLGFVIMKIYSRFHYNLKVVCNERKDIFTNLESSVKSLKTGNSTVLIHCASQGEFEEAKPIIKKLKKKYTSINIILTFYSPSGYKNYSPLKEIDIVSYLPFDSYWNVKRFYSVVNPSLIIIVKHDIWPNFIWTAQKRGTPVILIDAYLKNNSLQNTFLIKNFYCNLYEKIEFILTASEQDKKRFERFVKNKDNIIVIGDTRIDQVLKAAESNELEKKDYIDLQKPVLVAGSTWPEDEEIIVTAIKKLKKTFKDFYSIIVPHEPLPKNIQLLKDKLTENDIRFNTFSETGLQFSNQINTIIVDKMGILAKLYKLGDIAFVGGGFTTGIHNIMEPAVYGIPVFFGPRYDNSPEARALLKQKGVFSVRDSQELYNGIESFIKDDKKREKAGETAKNYVNSNLGASTKILQFIEHYIDKGSPVEKN